MNFESWMRSLPAEITGDPLWKVEAYRLSLFAAEVAWQDVTKLSGDRRTLDIAGQLYRAVGSVEANISEGYSRGGGRDRARFFEYALGSARESRGWYYKGRHILGGDVVDPRLRLFTQIVRLLITMVTQQRSSGSLLQEESPEYRTGLEDPTSVAASPPAQLPDLLKVVPMP